MIDKQQPPNTSSKVLPLVATSEERETTSDGIAEDHPEVLLDESTNNQSKEDLAHVPQSQLIDKLRKLRPKMWSDDE